MEQQLRQIRAKIQKKIDDSLNKEVAELVKNEISHAVETEIYQSGEPVEYDRRGENGFPGTGSLGDPQEMEHVVVNGRLIVMDLALPSKQYGMDLTKSIIKGYWDKNYWWNMPRDFLEKTRDNLRSSNSHVKVIKQALKKRGINVE